MSTLVKFLVDGTPLYLDHIILEGLKLWRNNLNDEHGGYLIFLSYSYDGKVAWVRNGMGHEHHYFLEGNCDGWRIYRKPPPKIKQAPCLHRIDNDAAWSISKTLFESHEQAACCFDGEVIWPYAPDKDGFVEVEK